MHFPMQKTRKCEIKCATSDSGSGKKYYLEIKGERNMVIWYIVHINKNNGLIQTEL